MSRPSSEAEGLYAEYLARHQGDEGADFEAWVLSHPALEDELRALWEKDREVEALLPGASLGDPGALFGRSRAAFSTDLRPGAIVGDFRLVSLVGQGGMGQVWKAEQISLGDRSVALKFVRPERVSTRALQSFQREARAGGRLNHPGIVAVHGYGESEGLAWIAMELVRGGRTLRDYLDEVRAASELPADYDRHAAALASEVADAMQAVHDAGVIHRDLKPHNVLLAQDGRPMVTDLGLARITDESALSKSGEFAGTYFYTSPEQVAAKRRSIDHRADIFSLGVVLYEMLALQRPFQGDTTHQVANQILFKDPPSLRSLRSRVPEDLVVIVGKALEKDPNNRYQSMRELGADVRRFLADEPILARPPAVLRQSWKWCRRHPTLSVGGVTMTGALTAISGLSILLAGKKVEASENARLAMEAGAAESQRAEDVLRLSALQEYEALLAEADELWPAHPDKIALFESWIARAQALVNELPRHRATREELRRGGLPRTPEQLQTDRERHPAYPELEALQSSIEAKRVALRTRRHGGMPSLPEIDWRTYPSELEDLDLIARSMTGPERDGHGAAVYGLVVARHIRDLIQEQNVSSERELQAASTLTWACISVGLDNEAREALCDALTLLPGADTEASRRALGELGAALDSAGSEIGLEAAQKELEELEAKRNDVEALLNERVQWDYRPGEAANRWWESQLTRLIISLEKLQDEETGLLIDEAIHPQHGWSLPKRLSVARSLSERFSPTGDLRTRWDSDLPRILERYPDLEFDAQMGLVPIGTDPESGLWEFWHVASGEEPRRDTSGRLRMEPSSGLVFVLLPAGRFMMGAQAENPNGPNYNRDASSRESPPHPVVLSPFLLSKYELTQAQWTRLYGHNPSAFSGAWNVLPSTWHGDLLDWSLHPVEAVSWFDSRNALAKLGCSLPTEAQWEYACRADRKDMLNFGESETPMRSTWPEPRGTRGSPNTTFRTSRGGYLVHAPIGLSRANDYGFHDMLDNVSEWCLDFNHYLHYVLSPPDDPLAREEEETCVHRGGGQWFQGEKRPSARRFNFPQDPHPGIGVRPSWKSVK